jgi:hypothetical protein
MPTTMPVLLDEFGTLLKIAMNIPHGLSLHCAGDFGNRSNLLCRSQGMLQPRPIPTGIFSNGPWRREAVAVKAITTTD